MLTLQMGGSFEQIIINLCIIAAFALTHSTDDSGSPSILLDNEIHKVPAGNGQYLLVFKGQGNGANNGWRQFQGCDMIRGS
ncbi:MAG: hypothetical protein P4L59_00625, partial [Desulfosporosinus sp.]|nr:hypothetical protein [Desulfosporosinus sp.]